MIRQSIVSAVFAIIFGSSAIAQDNQSVTSNIFMTVDSDNKGYLHLGDVEAFRQLVFLGMDTNGDKSITEEEYTIYDFGEAALANELNRRREYNAARKVIFHFWDLDASGEVSEAEHRRVTQYDFDRADVDNNGVLQFDEFDKHFTPHATIRAAMR